MHQARTAAEKHSHGRQTHLARLCSADRTEKPFFCSGERTRGFDDQVCSHQRPRLVIDRFGEAVAKRSNRDQRRNSERNREGKEEQSPPARAAVTPRHFRNE